jgi:hypothetical protein
VIKKPHGRGGHSPCWAAKPEKIIIINNNNNNNNDNNNNNNSIAYYTSRLYGITCCS